MKIYRKDSYLFVEAETLQDLEVLRKFPGFLEKNGMYFCPAKGPVIRNLLDRVKRFKPSIKVSVSDEVQELLADKDLLPLPEGFKFHTKPLPHQEIALRFLYTNKGGGLLLDPGLGKTKVCCDHILLEGSNRALVICPKPLLFVWEHEIKTHRPELTFHVFKTTDFERELEQARDKRVWIVNYAKATLLLKDLQTVRFDSLYIDEGLVKNPQSEQTKAITTLSSRIPIRVIMSGTLVNNSESDIFAPVRILEPSLLGTSFIRFRDVYLNTWNPYKDDPAKKHIAVISGAKDPVLMRDVLRASSVIMRKEVWLKDLPSKEFQYIKVPMPDEVKIAYFDLLRNYVVKIAGKTVEVDNPLSLMAKLSQLGNGFLYQDNSSEVSDLFLSNKPPKKGKKNRETYFFPTQPKLEAFSDLYTRELTTKKFVMWYCMDAERELIEKRLSDMGIRFTTIAGGEKDIQGKVGQFNEDPYLQCLLCQARTLNYGVTLLGQQDEPDDTVEQIFSDLSSEVCTMVFCSVGYSLEIFLQQQDRIHRIGQKFKCTYYIFVADTPTEAKLIQALSNKQVIRNVMLENWVHEALDLTGISN